MTDPLCLLLAIQRSAGQFPAWEAALRAEFARVSGPTPSLAPQKHAEGLESSRTAGMTPSLGTSKP